ncbi:MAG: hypothetical protein M3A44_02100 [Gammaproteobacteria bacterium]
MLVLAVGCSSKQSGTASLSAYPDPQSTGAKMFKARCAECHVPPQPSSRKVNEWPNIVGRMQHNLVMRGSAPLTDEEQREILGYLQKYAAGQS